MLNATQVPYGPGLWKLTVSCTCGYARCVMWPNLTSQLVWLWLFGVVWLMSWYSSWSMWKFNLIVMITDHFYNAPHLWQQSYIIDLTQQYKSFSKVTRSAPLLEHPQTCDRYQVALTRTERSPRRVWGERPRELNWSLWSLNCPTIYYKVWLCLSEGFILLVDKVHSFAQPTQYLWVMKHVRRINRMVLGLKIRCWLILW